MLVLCFLRLVQSYEGATACFRSVLLGRLDEGLGVAQKKITHVQSNPCLQVSTQSKALLAPERQLGPACCAVQRSIVGMVLCSINGCHGSSIIWKLSEYVANLLQLAWLPKPHQQHTICPNLKRSSRSTIGKDSKLITDLEQLCPLPKVHYTPQDTSQYATQSYVLYAWLYAWLRVKHSRVQSSMLLG